MVLLVAAVVAAQLPRVVELVLQCLAVVLLEVEAHRVPRSMALASVAGTTVLRLRILLILCPIERVRPIHVLSLGRLGW